MSNNLTFEVDKNVINHLGVGLYSSTPAALAELVANSWDAEASKVKVTVNDTDNSIVIEDNGHGMTLEELKDKFLTVGYSRRNTPQKNKSKTGLRNVMGRKGIGKLAVFALAETVQITTQSSTRAPIAFKINVKEFKESLERGEKKELEEIDSPHFEGGSGTRIELFNVLNGLNKTVSYLKIKLARRFAVLGANHAFQIFVNNSEITLADRDFYQHIQLLWVYDQNSKDQVTRLATKIASIPETDESNNTIELKCIKDLKSVITLPDKATYKITGYIASVEKPSQLGGKEINANMLSLFANGKVFVENLFANELSSAKHYQNYLVGEIHADFLDDDDVDRATANREAVKKDDEKYKFLLGFVEESLKQIDKEWDEWRIALGFDKNDPLGGVVNEWLDKLKDPRDKKIAKKLVSSIQKATYYDDELKNITVKKQLLTNTIVGFEKLKLTNQLDRLDSVTDVFSPEFAAIFSTLGTLEETAYTEITRKRLEIIERFKKIKDDSNALEKVAQEFLFDNLWLLDPAWDRVTGRAELEKIITNHIKSENKDITGSRLDISYRTSSGRHVVVELKKPSKTVTYDEISKQVRKYRQAIGNYYSTKEPNKSVPELDIYVLVKKTPIDFDENDRKSLNEQRAVILTYEQLINDAINAYQEYLESHRKFTYLDTILNKLR